MKLMRSSVWANSSAKSSLASRCSRHHASSASNRRRASSSRTTFTASAILPEIFRGVHAATGLGVVERAVQRGVQRCPLLGAKLVVDHDDFYLGAIGQVGGLVQHEPAVLHLHLESLHAPILPLTVAPVRRIQRARSLWRAARGPRARCPPCVG